MADNLFHLPKPSFASLLDGLIQDFRTLVAQELRLAKHEVKDELEKARGAATSIALGIGFGVVGGLLLIIMLVLALQAATDLPLWVCYGIVGGLLVIAGGILLWRGKTKAADVHVVPRRTVQTIKENATWIKEQATSQKT